MYIYMYDKYIYIDIIWDSIGYTYKDIYVYMYTYERVSKVRAPKRQSQHGSFEAGPAGAKRPQRAKRATRAKRGMLGAKRRGS